MAILGFTCTFINNESLSAKVSPNKLNYHAIYLSHRAVGFSAILLDIHEKPMSLVDFTSVASLLCIPQDIATAWSQLLTLASEVDEGTNKDVFLGGA